MGAWGVRLYEDDIALGTDSMSCKKGKPSVKSQMS